MTTRDTAGEARSLKLRRLRHKTITGVDAAALDTAVSAFFASEADHREGAVFLQIRYAEVAGEFAAFVLYMES